MVAAEPRGASNGSVDGVGRYQNPAPDRTSDVDSLVRSDDLVGREGQVSLAIEAGGRGFVELSARGSLIRRPSRSSCITSANPVRC